MQRKKIRKKREYNLYLLNKKKKIIKIKTFMFQKSSQFLHDVVVIFVLT